MDAVTNTKPFVRKPVNCEEIEKRAIRMDLEPAPEGKYDISDMTVFDPNSEEQKNAAMTISILKRNPSRPFRPIMMDQCQRRNLARRFSTSLCPF